MNISMRNQKKTTPKHITVKLLKNKMKETRGKDGHELYLGDIDYQSAEG